MTPPFSTPAVNAAFDVGDPVAGRGLLVLRALVFDTAAKVRGIGPLEEAVRWGQPAYLTRVGSTLRLGVSKTARFAIFVHCRTTLISDFITAFPGQDRIEGTRAILFDDPSEISETRHGWLIARAITYRKPALLEPAKG